MTDTLARDGATDCFSPASINSLQLKNRFIKAGTFENMTPGGIPSEQLNNFHRYDHTWLLRSRNGRAP
jgi:hypothetical protein